MKYGFADEPTPEVASARSTIVLAPQRTDQAGTPDPLGVAAAVDAGRAAGFIPRQTHQSERRKPGPRRTEPQGKLTLTGPKRVLDRLQAHCDVMGGVPYWQAIEDLLDRSDQ